MGHALRDCMCILSLYTAVLLGNEAWKIETVGLILYIIGRRETLEYHTTLITQRLPTLHGIGTSYIQLGSPWF